MTDKELAARDLYLMKDMKSISRYVKKVVKRANNNW